MAKALTGSWATGPFPCLCEGANAAAGGALTLATGVSAHPAPAPYEEQAAECRRLAGAWGTGPELAWEREWGPTRLARVQPPPGEARAGGCWTGYALGDNTRTCRNRAQKTAVL